jgi:hypothetical protein
MIGRESFQKKNGRLRSIGHVAAWDRCSVTPYRCLTPPDVATLHDLVQIIHIQVQQRPLQQRRSSIKALPLRQSFTSDRADISPISCSAGLTPACLYGKCPIGVKSANQAHNRTIRPNLKRLLPSQAVKFVNLSAR